MTDFSRNRFTWLNQVAADRTISCAAFKVAYVIAGFINRETGEAWPTQQTIAAAVGLSDRAIRPLIMSLVEGGHMTCRSGRGKHNPNVYRLAMDMRKPASAVDDAKAEAGFRNSKSESGSFTSHKRKFSAAKAEADFRQNQIHEPDIEPDERDTSRPADLFGEEKSRRKDEPKAAPRRQKIDLTEPFSEFWTQYPRKAGKNAARAAYQRVISKGEATPDDLLAGATRYAAEREGQEPRFTKHPAAWLNGGHWSDEPAAPAAPQYQNGARYQQPMSAVERNLRRVYERQQSSERNSE